MGELRIRNWSRWQSYRSDRNLPPWIKVHRRLMNDPNWVALSDAERGQVVSLWMLAADRDGRIPDDPKLLQRLCHMDTPPDINRLKELEFLDVKVASSRRQPGVSVTPQTRLDKTRLEREERAAKAAFEDSKPNGKDRHLDPKADLYRRAHEVFGPKFGGQVTKALAAYGDDVAEVRSLIERSSTKANPKEYFGAVLRKANQEPERGWVR